MKIFSLPGAISFKDRDGTSSLDKQLCQSYRRKDQRLGTKIACNLRYDFLVVRKWCKSDAHRGIASLETDI